jgi:hypothetical protein
VSPEPALGTVRSGHHKPWQAKRPETPVCVGAEARPGAACNPGIGYAECLRLIGNRAVLLSDSSDRDLHWELQSGKLCRDRFLHIAIDPSETLRRRKL